MLGPDATPEDAAELRARLGLDRPILVQYLSFLGQAVQGDLGTSLFFDLPVTEVLAQRAEPTAFLALFSLLVVAGDRAADRHLRGLPARLDPRPGVGDGGDAGGVDPELLDRADAAALLRDRARAGSRPRAMAGPDASFLDRMGYLVLPSIVLGIVNSALILRFTRASMLDVLGEDYIRTARSKGMAERRVVLRHALKNAAIPIVTVVGLTFALLVSGAVVTERVFNIPGMGNLVVSAVLRRDYPVIQGTLIVVAVLYVLINLVTDLLYLAIDRRVRY